MTDKTEKKVEVKFIVRRKFKYGKTWLMPGDQFVPAGGKFDDGIMRSNLVRLSTDDYRHPSRIGVRRRKGHVKLGKKAGKKTVEVSNGN